MYAFKSIIQEFVLYLRLPFILFAASLAPVQAEVPSVNAFYNNIASRRQAVVDICSMGVQWNSATGGSFYSYLNQRIQEAWQRGDSVMVNRYRAEGIVAKKFCSGIF